MKKYKKYLKIIINITMVKLLQYKKSLLTKQKIVHKNMKLHINIIVHQNDNINTTTANNSNKNSPVPPSTSSTTISTSNVVEITTKATKKKKKKSNVHILFKSENNMSMEEMRALAWKKNKLLSKLQ